MWIIDFFNLSESEIKYQLSEFFDPKRFYMVENEKNNIIEIQKLLTQTGPSFISKNFKNNMINEFNQSLQKIDNFESHLFNEHLMNFFHFLDFLCQTDNNMKMSFKPPSYEDTSADIQGIYADELWKFSNTISGLNIFSWYNTDNKNEINIKGLQFKNFNEDVQIIKNCFLSDITQQEFESFFETYLDTKISWQ